MSITLQPELEPLIHRLKENGHYPDTDSVMVAALELLEVRLQMLDELRAELQIGIDEADRGELIPYTETFWDDLDREIDAELQVVELAQVERHS